MKKMDTLNNHCYSIKKPQRTHTPSNKENYHYHPLQSFLVDTSPNKAQQNRNSTDLEKPCSKSPSCSLLGFKNFDSKVKKLLQNTAGKSTFNSQLLQQIPLSPISRKQSKIDQQLTFNSIMSQSMLNESTIQLGSQNKQRVDKFKKKLDSIFKQQKRNSKDIKHQIINEINKNFQNRQKYLCINHINKRAKYVSILEEEDDIDHQLLYYCTKCAVKLITKGFKVQEIDAQRKKNDFQDTLQNAKLQLKKKQAFLKQLQDSFQHHYTTQFKSHDNCFLQIIKQIQKYQRDSKQQLIKNYKQGLSLIQQKKNLLNKKQKKLQKIFNRQQCKQISAQIGKFNCKVSLVFCQMDSSIPIKTQALLTLIKQNIYSNLAKGGVNFSFEGIFKIQKQKQAQLSHSQIPSEQPNNQLPRIFITQRKSIQQNQYNPAIQNSQKTFAINTQRTQKDPNEYDEQFISKKEDGLYSPSFKKI